MHPLYRPDIDGLRAVAVLSVLIHHAFPEHFRTGYIGVDVFFVISGFLISCILFASLEQGRFSLLDFYRRRILRIFPALVTVVLAVFLAGWYVLFSSEFAQLGRHIVAGAGFVSNFLLWSEAGYFDTTSYDKPLLHLWSLGIEEQFYILWPWLLWLFWSRHLGFLALTGCLLLLSFAWNLREVMLGHDTADFYSPLSRLWELMAGGCLAYMHQHAARFPRLHQWRLRWQGLQSWAGLALLVTGLVVLKGHLAYPGYRALLPVTGALLLISAGPEPWVNRYLLANRPMVWVGLISYPLYLWHWPLLALAHVIEGRLPDVELRFQLMGLSVLLATLTYVAIERPVRFGLQKRDRAAWSLVAAMLLLAALGAATDRAQGFPARAANANEHVLGMSQALQAPVVDQQFCRQLYQVQPGREVLCALHSPEPYYLMVGDSHAGSLSLGVAAHQDLFPDMLLASPGCLPLVDSYVQSSRLPPGDHRCRSLAQAVFMALDRIPSLRHVLLVNRGPIYFTSVDFGVHPQTDIAIYDHEDRRQSGVAAMQAWLSGYDDLVSRLEARGVRVSFMIDWPELDFVPRACVPRAIELGSRHACTIARARVEERQHDYRQLIARLQAMHPSLDVYDSNRLFCGDDSCSALVGGVLQYLDDDHLTQRGSESVLLGFLHHGASHP
ncbi:MAG: hypothetical protein RIQ52_1140 [Pseudomonadota bacterium]|jgi:peptidoglycan/LPS O-acetylase OafA/YrhL